MNRTAAVVLACLAFASPALGGGEACRRAAAARAPAAEAPSLDRFLFFAVLEGLAEDGIGDEAVAAVLEKDAEGRYRNFVYSCPVCTPVVEAFRAYALRGEFAFSRKGDDPFRAETPEDALEVAAGLASKDVALRGAALQAFVERCVEARFRRLRLTEEERDPWRILLKEGMGRGMKALESGASPGFAHKSCPSCDGGVGRTWNVTGGDK